VRTLAKTCAEVADKLREAGFIVTYVDEPEPGACVINFKDRFTAKFDNPYLTNSLYIDLRTGEGSVNIVRKLQRDTYEWEIGPYCTEEPYSCRIHVDFPEKKFGVQIGTNIRKHLTQIVEDLQLPVSKLKPLKEI